MSFIGLVPSQLSLYLNNQNYKRTSTRFIFNLIKFGRVDLVLCTLNPYLTEARLDSKKITQPNVKCYLNY